MGPIRISFLLSVVLAVGSGCGSPSEFETESPSRAAVGRPETPASASAAGTPATLRELCVAGRPSLASLVAPGCVQDDTLDDALSTISLDRCSLRIESTIALANDGVRRPTWLGPALDAPLSFGSALRKLGGELDESVESRAPVANAIAKARSAASGASTHCFMVEDAPLADVLQSRTLVADADAAKAKDAVSKLPPELARALGPIVAALADAAGAVAQNLPPAGAERSALENYANFMLWSAPSVPTATDLAVVARTNIDPIAEAATRLALVVEQANLAQFRGLATPDVTIATKLGDIVVRGPGAHDDAAASDRAVVLLVDTGGADVHRDLAGAASTKQPVSVMVDLDGADRYGYVETDPGTKTRLPADASGRLSSGQTKSRTPRQGGAWFGIGLTFDFGEGADVYRSLAVAQGAGVFGVGALYDEGGNDDYAAEVLAQGAAIAGIGLAIDRAGNDVFHLFARGQGYGAASGVGALVDLAGSDRYRADPGEPKFGGDLLYPSDLLSGPKAPVTANHNAAQGCGEGRRGLPSETIASGGLGLLRDKAGDDDYEAGAFAQACGLEEGAGALLDGSGSDHYDALAYAQGAGIHRGIGLFVDESGDDEINKAYPIQATSIAVGHDFGFGMLLDLGGTDVVVAPTLSLGSGSANGLGVFVASGGADRFIAKTNASFGASIANGVSSQRNKLSTVGVFVKVDGAGSYQIGGREIGYAGTIWHQSRDPKNSALRSVGVDAPKGRASL